MKKILYVLLFSIVLAGCSSNEEVKENTDKEAIEVDKGLLNVEITLPASFFEGEDISEVIADAKKDGVEEVIENDDGSLTYKMSKAKHAEMMEELREGMLESIEGLKTGEDFQSIKDVTYNDEFSEFTLVVDQEAFENSWDALASLGLGMSGMFYQLFNGVDIDDYKVEISVENMETEEVFDTIVYPDALDQSEEEN